MSSICAVINFEDKTRLSVKTVSKMGETMWRRGPDERGIYSSDFAIFQHNRLCVTDPENGLQPMTAEWQGRKYTIIYNGEIYNSPELRRELRKKGVTFKTECDTETVLWSYIIYKEKCPEMLNGIFAFAVMCENERRVYICRDRLGVKPLYYAKIGSDFVVASEIKAILAHPEFRAEIDRKGLWELLFLAPVTLNGSGVFKGINELGSATAGYIDANGMTTAKYWTLKAKAYNGSAEEAAAITEEILTDAVCRELKSDRSRAVLLSGGLDSSVVTAIAAEDLRKQGETLSTYSFQYDGNKENFVSSMFQPEGDDEFALYLADHLKTDHTVLTADNIRVAECLFPAVEARDFPGQADIDSSLLYFCNEIKKKHTVVLSGECSDEIFGGYPWFYRPEMLYRDFFPFIHDPFARVSLFDDKLTQKEEGYDYLSKIYKKIILDCPVLEEDSEDMALSRRATWLSVNYFGASLLERKDRMSMYSSVEARVPFADHRLLEFVYNVPWSIKFENGVEKALLRNAMKRKLPDKILWRKKSPYPKTHSPVYENAVRKLLIERINKGGALAEMLDKNKFCDILSGTTPTWFGQLMGGPQLMAWLVQFDYFAEKYSVDFKL